MKEKMRLLSLIAAVAALVLLLPGSGAMNASADSGSATYQYLAGTGFICGLEPDACPDVAEASNGDRVEITGSGTITIHPKSATGGGTFTHKDPNGNVVGQGAWIATELLSLDIFGTGVPPFPPEFTAGRALIRVRLLPSGGGQFGGILRVTCHLPDVPSPPGTHEGVRLNVQGAVNFNKEVSGLTLFIRQ